MKEDLKNRLTDIQYHVTQENGTEQPFEMNTIVIMKKEFMSTLFQENHCLVRKINMMRDVDGQALRNQLKWTK